MANRFTSGKHAIAECDRCSFRFKLSELKKLTIKTKQVNIKVCKECWEQDHPQLQLGMYPIADPQAVREPRRDNSYTSSGLLADGSIGEGSRIIEWGWNPVGLANPLELPIPNNLLATGQVGTVTVTIT